MGRFDRIEPVPPGVIKQVAGMGAMTTQSGDRYREIFAGEEFPQFEQLVGTAGGRFGWGFFQANQYSASPGLSSV